jgi:hypothetical protein
MVHRVYVIGWLLALIHHGFRNGDFELGPAPLLSAQHQGRWPKLDHR